MNCETIEGDDLFLIPYREEHVLKYHEWMKDEYLLEMTASEPLTLDEEYEMQKSWSKDDSKITFILYSPSYGDIIGDVNLYIADTSTGEIEVMIAEESQRGKGYAKKAVQYMMKHAVTLGITTFIAKILDYNHASIKLFTSLGYTEISRSPVFKQIDYIYSV